MTDDMLAVRGTLAAAMCGRRPAPPFPPLPVGAPENVQGWFNYACQKYEREQVAKNILDTLAPDVDQQLKKDAESEYAWAQTTTTAARALYIQALEDAGYRLDDRETA